MPDGWKPERWIAFCSFLAGGTYDDAAELANVSTGTVSRWLKAWRKVYGPQLFKAEAKSNERANQRRQGNIERREWREARLQQANASGVLAGKAAEVLDEMLDRYRADVKAGRVQVDASDLLALSQVVERSVQVADRLVGIPHPDKVVRLTQNNLNFGEGGAPPSKGVVAALEGKHGRSDDTATKIATAKKALLGIQALRRPPIEVQESNGQ
jgi:hypothetical protein